MLSLLLLSRGLSVGAGTPDVHPKITWQKCTKAGCTPQSGGIVIDSEWREAVDDSGKSCYKDNRFDTTVCANEAECTAKCKLQGFTYSKASVSTSGSSVRLGFLNPDKSIGSRVYLFDETAGTYVNFKVLNKEFTFDIDTSAVPCAVNGALYFSEMDPDGGLGRFPDNKAGAKYGTGYCDAQCPRDGKFIAGRANFERKYGSCCFEWDIWEGNVGGEQMAAHPCSSLVNTPSWTCTSQCGQCDTAGCAWNPYKIESNIGGQHVFYGPGKKVDPSKKFTVVTQFHTTDKSDLGSLKEVRRLYVQGGKVIANNVKTQNGVPFDSIGDDFCAKGSSGDASYVTTYGGDRAFTASFRRGAVLAMSIWTDGSMSWLDAGDAGTCSGSVGGKDALIARYPNAYVEYSNIKFGDIDTTY
jgi:cellulose 1,4-beta-cellobiosidase